MKTTAEFTTRANGIETVSILINETQVTLILGATFGFSSIVYSQENNGKASASGRKNVLITQDINRILSSYRGLANEEVKNNLISIVTPELIRIGYMICE